MSMLYLSSSPKFADHMEKFVRLTFLAKVTFNATPASKIHSGDLEGDSAFLRTQGLTAAADAIDNSITWTSPVDNSGGATFGVLLVGANLAANSHGIQQVYNASASTPLRSTPLTITTQGPNATSISSCLSSNGNIAIEFTNSSLNFATTSDSFAISVEYKLY